MKKIKKSFNKEDTKVIGARIDPKIVKRAKKILGIKTDTQLIRDSIIFHMNYKNIKTPEKTLHMINKLKRDISTLTNTLTSEKQMFTERLSKNKQIVRACKHKVQKLHDENTILNQKISEYSHYGRAIVIDDSYNFLGYLSSEQYEFWQSHDITDFITYFGFEEQPIMIIDITENDRRDNIEKI